MKLTNRAKSALATAGFSVVESSVIAQLVAFAAQNSGIERGNYYDFRDPNRQAVRDGRRAFSQEARSITADWRRFKEALNIAAVEGVTDADIIAEAPHAFSGRLAWHPNDLKPADSVPLPAGHWQYCTGQYFPTEYRKAAATLLEYATRNVRQARPPEHRKITCIAELKALNAKNGGCWFEAGTMRFFGTHIETGIIRGKYFVTSEQPPHDSRKYSVRSFDDEGDVDTVGKFCGYNTRADAVAAVPQN